MILVSNDMVANSSVRRGGGLIGDIEGEEKNSSSCLNLNQDLVVRRLEQIRVGFDHLKKEHSCRGTRLSSRSGAGWREHDEFEDLYGSGC